MRTLLAEEDPRDHVRSKYKELEYRFTTRALPSPSMEFFLHDRVQPFPFTLLVRLCGGLQCPTDLTVSLSGHLDPQVLTAHEYTSKAQNMTWPEAFPHLRSFSIQSKLGSPWFSLLPRFLDKCVKLQHLVLSLHHDTTLVIPTSVWLKLLHRLASLFVLCVSDCGLEAALTELLASGALEGIVLSMKRLEVHRLCMSANLLQLIGYLLSRVSLRWFDIGEWCRVRDEHGVLHAVDVSEWLSVMDCSELKSIDARGVHTNGKFWQLVSTRATGLSSLAVCDYVDLDDVSPVGWCTSLSDLAKQPDVLPHTSIRSLHLSALGFQPEFPPEGSLSRCVVISPFAELHKLSVNGVAVTNHDLLTIVKFLLQLRHLHINVYSNSRGSTLALNSVPIEAWRQIVAEQAAYKHRRNWEILTPEQLTEDGCKNMIENLAGYLFALKVNRRSAWTEEFMAYLTSQKLVRVRLR